MIYIYCFFKGVLQLIFSGLLLVEATKTNSVLGIFQNSTAPLLKCILQISLLPCPVWTWKWMFSMWHHFLLVGRIYALGTSSKLDLPTVNSYCFFQWNVDCFWVSTYFLQHKSLFSWVLFLPILVPSNTAYSSWRFRNIWWCLHTAFSGTAILLGSA